eukprot:7462640-Heterocapsa_arctica.AAC.1
MAGAQRPDRVLSGKNFLAWTLRSRFRRSSMGPAIASLLYSSMLLSLGSACAPSILRTDLGSAALAAHESNVAVSYTHLRAHETRSNL